MTVQGPGVPTGKPESFHLHQWLSPALPKQAQWSWGRVAQEGGDMGGVLVDRAKEGLGLEAPA